MDKKQELVFEFRIHAVTKDNGIDFEPAIFNQGVPMEFVLTMMRSWIRNIENAYDEDFKKYA